MQKYFLNWSAPFFLSGHLWKSLLKICCLEKLDITISTHYFLSVAGCSVRSKSSVISDRWEYHQTPRFLVWDPHSSSHAEWKGLYSPQPCHTKALNSHRQRAGQFMVVRQFEHFWQRVPQTKVPFPGQCGTGQLLLSWEQCCSTRLVPGCSFRGTALRSEPAEASCSTLAASPTWPLTGTVPQAFICTLLRSLHVYAGDWEMLLLSNLET